MPVFLRSSGEAVFVEPKKRRRRGRLREEVDPDLRAARWYRDVVVGQRGRGGTVRLDYSAVADRDGVSESLVRKAVRRIEREIAELPSAPVVRFGCRPLVPCYGQALYDPSRPDAPFHAPTILAGEVGDHAWPTTDCPGCRGRVTASAFCGWCGGLAPRFEHAAAAQREAKSILTELERRRFWSNAAPGWLNREIPGENREIKGLILDTRTWLAIAGQQPDYDQVLDRRGNVLGRLGEGWTPPGGWSQRKSWMPRPPQTKTRTLRGAA